MKTIKQLIMKQIFLIITFLCLIYSGFSSTVTISGYIKDSKNGEALIGATCYIPEVQNGTISNQYGFYSITIPESVHKVSFSFIGYETQSVNMEIKKDTVLNVLLAEETKQLEAVVVTATKKDRNVESTEMSMEKLPVQLVKKLPSFRSNN